MTDHLVRALSAALFRVKGSMYKRALQVPMNVLVCLAQSLHLHLHHRRHHTLLTPSFCSAHVILMDSERSNGRPSHELPYLPACPKDQAHRQAQSFIARLMNDASIQQHIFIRQRKGQMCYSLT